MARLHNGYAVGKRFQHIESLGLTIHRGNRKDIDALQKTHLAVMVGRIDVHKMLVQARILEALPECAEIRSITFAKPAGDQ